MICKSCGGEYEDKELKCPFCNSENPVAVLYLKEDIIQGYEEEAEDIRQNLPTRVVKKGTKMYIKALFLLFGVAVLIAIVVTLSSKSKANQEYEEQKKNKAYLEGLFEEGKYEEISKYIDDHNIYKGYYQKYVEINYVWHKKIVVESMVSAYEDMAKLYDADHYYVQDARQSTIDQCNLFFKTCRDYLEDKSDLGNEEVIGQIKEEILNMLLKHGFTVEEFDV